jgi:hypothetical protein
MRKEQASTGQRVRAEAGSPSLLLCSYFAVGHRRLGFPRLLHGARGWENCLPLRPLDLLRLAAGNSPSILIAVVQLLSLGEAAWAGWGLGDVWVWPISDVIRTWGHLQRPILDLATAQTLTRISQAGSAVSMIFLAFTMVLYVAFR